jgi:hypothetical protein
MSEANKALAKRWFERKSGTKAGEKRSVNSSLPKP